MNLHHILWGLLDLKDDPKDPSSQLLAEFTMCISTEGSLHECQEGPSLISPSLIQIGSSVSVMNSGHIAAQVWQVEEHMLEYMQGILLRFYWHLDLRQTAYSLYNAACRIV